MRNHHHLNTIMTAIKICWMLVQSSQARVAASPCVHSLYINSFKYLPDIFTKCPLCSKPLKQHLKAWLHFGINALVLRLNVKTD